MQKAVMTPSRKPRLHHVADHLISHLLGLDVAINARFPSSDVSRMMVSFGCQFDNGVMDEILEYRKHVRDDIETLTRGWSYPVGTSCSVSVSIFLIAMKRPVQFLPQSTSTEAGNKAFRS